MNKIKLLSLLQDFFNADEKEKRDKAVEIRGVIKKLKNKHRKTTKMLNECRDEELKKALRMEADIIQAQIEKGIEVLKQL
ncbi:hypothetical protein [Methylomarinum vadi]|uniref:hypothetical protein n=1 Tax=Methylomarinum vadi TaxID=438855 RepID=UPI0004DECF84|nr:hypothetical protein [Methylomarinum vadi]